MGRIFPNVGKEDHDKRRSMGDVDDRKKITKKAPPEDKRSRVVLRRVEPLAEGNRRARIDVYGWK